MRNLLTLFCLFLLFSGTAFSQQDREITREEYIELYKDLAIKEMRRSGVPASITLAQGMLESDNGNSRLARKANNHFGIKCHNSWDGKRIYHDDDEKGECFRKYKSVYESYEDHSDFLRNTSRYDFLFELDQTDYKGWARGLKKAGYATNPQYDKKLITIIEENDLHQYDLGSRDVKTDRYIKNTHEADTSLRKIMQRNRVDYVVAEQGDTYESLRKELNLMPNELFRYNDLTRDSLIYPGQVLYLQPKRNRAEVGNNYHTVEKGESMWQISQDYAVKLDKLYRKNNMNPGEEPEPGRKLSLRKNLKGAAPTSKVEEPEEDETEPLKFEFD